MKQFIFLLAMFLTSTLGFGQVQNTPNLHTASTDEIWGYIQSIGYTTDIEIVEELLGVDKWKMRYYRAKNPSDNSSVEFTTRYFDDGEKDQIFYVVYTWAKKRDMPKGLEKITSKWVNDYRITKGRYKKHYICSNFGNPKENNIGSNPNNFFQIFVNGQSVTGFY